MFWFRRHSRYRDQLSAHIDGELDAAAARRLEAHLAECEACRAELEQLRDTVGALGELPEASVPRSFALTPEQAAARRAVPPAAPLAFGARIAAAGVAAALAAVLVVDIGDLGGDGPSDDALAPQMLSERDEEGDAFEALEDDAAPAATGGTGTGRRSEATPLAGTGAEAPEGPPETEAPDREMGFTSDMDAAGTPADGAEAAEPPAATAFSSIEELEAAVEEELGRDDDGGIGALTVAEITLASALALLVAGSLGLAVAGRRR